MLPWLAVALLAGGYGAAFALLFPGSLMLFFVPILLLGLGVIWALPDSATAPTRLLTGLFFAFLLGAILWPDYLALSLPGLPWITLRRVIAAPLVLALLICASISSSFRKQVGQTLAAEPVVTRLFLAFVAIQFLSLPLSRELDASIDDLIVAQLYWTAMFLAGCYVFRRPGSVERWATFLCLTLVPLSALAIWEWSRSQVPWAGSIPSFLRVEDEQVQRILTGAARAATGKYRVQSVWTTSLGFAEFLALITPFLIHFVVGPFRFFTKLLALAALPLTFFLIVLTDARLGAAGFFLSFILYLGAWAGVRWKQSESSLFGPAITLAYPVLLAMFVAATLFIGRLQRMVWGGGEHQPSTNARNDQYAKGFDILAGNPIGHGVGRGGDTLAYTNLAGVQTIDTYYVLIALEYGVLGFIAYYGMLIWASVRSGATLLKSSKLNKETTLLMPLCLSVLVFITLKAVFSEDDNHPLIFMMLAAMLALIARSKAEDRQGQRGES
jgi:hypothetical protein